jgi:hypothetical protein
MTRPGFESGPPQWEANVTNGQKFCAIKIRYYFNAHNRLWITPEKEA